MRALVFRWSGGTRLCVRQLNPGVGGDHIGYARRDQQQSLVVTFGSHQRDGFTLEASYLAVGKDGFETISDFDAGAVVANGVKDQDALIGGFCTDTPLVEKINGIALDVGAVERIDRDYGDLRVGFFVDLMADIRHLRSCALVEDVGEIVDVAGGLEVFNRLGVRGDGERENEKRQKTDLRAHLHTKIVQEWCGRSWPGDGRLR